VRRAAAVASLALALGGCAFFPDKGTVTGPGFVLVSPFGRDATERWRQLVADDVEAVAALFRSDLPDPPATVVLDPIDVPESAAITERLDPRVDGLGGQAAADGRIRLIVARNWSGLISVSNHAKLRHELAHLFLHRRCPGAPMWLHEGLAHEVDDAVSARDGLAFHPAPVRLALARAFAAKTDDSSLWTWASSPSPEREQETSHRILAASFFRFQRELAGERWPDELPRLAALRPAEEPSLVAAWRAWLDGLDFATLVARGTGDPDPAIRTAAANALPQLAEAAGVVTPLHDVIGPATDAVALRILADPVCWNGAATYLVWFRADAIADADVAALRAPDAPASCRLVGLALAARRGAAVDAAEVRSLRAALPDDVRTRSFVLRPFLPGLD
jgi:hypothetical protein